MRTRRSLTPLRPFGLLPLVLLAVALLAAACGGDDGLSTSSSTTASTSAATDGTDGSAGDNGLVANRAAVLAECEGLDLTLTKSSNVDTSDVDHLAEVIRGQADAVDFWIGRVSPLVEAGSSLVGPIARLGNAVELYRSAAATLDGVDDVEDVPVAGDMAFVAAGDQLVRAAAAINGVLGADCFSGVGREAPPANPVDGACRTLFDSLDLAKRRSIEGTAGGVRAWAVLSIAAYDDWAAAVEATPPDGVDPATWTAAVDDVTARAHELFGLLEDALAERADDEALSDQELAGLVGAPEVAAALDRFVSAAQSVNELAGGADACTQGS